MLIADDTLLALYDQTRISSLLGESIEINGMTFSDVLLQLRFRVNRTRLYAKGIGVICSGDSKIIYYRVNGVSNGSLAGTPFESGGYLDGFFFTP